MDAVFNTGHVSQHRIVNTYFKKLKWLLKWEPSTCTVNIHFAWFPLSSTAWQITSGFANSKPASRIKITYYGRALSWIVSSLWFTPVYRSSWLTKVSCRSFVLWTFCKYGRFCICRSKRRFCWLNFGSFDNVAFLSKIKASWNQMLPLILTVNVQVGMVSSLVYRLTNNISFTNSKLASRLKTTCDWRMRSGVISYSQIRPAYHSNCLVKVGFNGLVFRTVLYFRLLRICRILSSNNKTK